MQETRRIKAHDKFILDGMRRQAGTLDKAVLEGCMNAIEAGAEAVHVSFKANDAQPGYPGAELLIDDMGTGFTSRQHIEDCFETLGTPHEASEHKIWAEFRMGRGQLFSFGKNIWRTGQFRMTVDLNNRGLDYSLEDGLDIVQGCHIAIQLYANPVGTYYYPSIEKFRDEIKRQVEFMETPIYFNGQRINTPASQCTWDLVTDDAYFLFNAGSNFRIYNLGAYVMAKETWQTGVNGICVSRKRLRVNFARNDIQSDCQIYPKIQAVIQENKIKKTRKSPERLTEDERVATLLDLRDGIQDYNSVKRMNLLETSSGRVLSLDTFFKNTLPWCFAPEGDRIADVMMQSGQALTLSRSMLSRLCYNGEELEFFGWLVNDQADVVTAEKFFRSWDEVKEGVSTDYRVIPYEDMTRVEKRFARVIESYPVFKGRKIVIGLSDSAYAWTDGFSYIAINRSLLNRTSLSSYTGAAQVVHTLFHELSHDEEDTGSHIHGESFYRRFYELTSNGSLSIIGELPAAMKNARRAEQTEVAIAKKQKQEMKLRRKLNITDCS
jgi:hypothetical protein